MLVQSDINEEKSRYSLFAFSFINKVHLFQVTEVYSKTRNGEDVRITITLTNELPPTSPTCLQFYNIIFRRFACPALSLQEVI